MRLKRELGLLNATMMGLGSTICAGIFVVLGPAVEIAGPAVILSFLLCGIINIATMLSYCELGAAMPRMGGEYVYVMSAFEGVPSFITGWFEWSSNIFYATLMVLGSAYLLHSITALNPYVIMGIVVLAFTLINLRGIRSAGTAQTLLTLVLLAIIALFIGAGLVHGFKSNSFEPFMPKGPLSVVIAVALIFETYVGVEAIAATQAEIKRPGKNIPRAMILCSMSLIALYTLVAFVSVGVVSPEALAGSLTPLNLVAETTMGNVGVIFVTSAGLIAALTSLNSAMIASSRAACAMGHAGHFPRCLKKVHSVFGTPYLAIIFGSFIILLLSVVDNLEFIVYSINFGFLIGFSLVNLSLIKLRRSRPNMNRPFKTPLYPLTPIVGILTSVGLLAFFNLKSLAFGTAWGLLGLLVYLYKRRGRKQR